MSLVGLLTRRNTMSRDPIMKPELEKCGGSFSLSPSTTISGKRVRRVPPSVTCHLGFAHKPRKSPAGFVEGHPGSPLNTLQLAIPHCLPHVLVDCLASKPIADSTLLSQVFCPFDISFAALLAL